MTSEDLLKKYLSPESYANLEQNKKDLYFATIKNYENQIYNFFKSYKENLDNARKIEEDSNRRKESWGTLYDYTLGIPVNIVAGAFEGIVEFASGAVSLIVNTADNIYEMFRHEGRFGNDFGGFGKELLSDLAYVFIEPISNMAEGVAVSGISFIDSIPKFINQGIEFFGGEGNLKPWISERAKQSFYSTASETSEGLKKYVLTGDKSHLDSGNFLSPNGFGRFNPSINYQKDQTIIEDHHNKWAKDTTIWSMNAQNYYKTKISPSIKNVLSGTLAEVVNNTERNGWQEFIDGTSHSVGRMVPMLAAAYLGQNIEGAVGEALGFLGKSYFFASSFGASMNEGIQNGASYEDAYKYGLSVALIETLTEQIDGFAPWQGLQNATAKTILGEGSEELLAELFQEGLSQMIGEDTNNEDVFTRAMLSAAGGALSGLGMNMANNFLSRNSSGSQTSKFQRNYNKMVEGSDKQKGKFEANVKNDLDALVNSYNRDSAFDSPIIEAVYDYETKEYQKNKANDPNLVEPTKLESTKEGRREAKIRYLNIMNQNNVGFVSYNESTGLFELNNLGKALYDNSEGFINGIHNGQNLDLNNVVHSKKVDGGLIHDNDVVFATKEQYEKLDSNKKQLFNNILNSKNAKNVFLIDGNGDFGSTFMTNGVIYIDVNAPILNTLGHELVHRLDFMSQSGHKGFGRLMEIFKSEQMQKALRKNGIVIMDAKLQQQYFDYYSKELKNNQVLYHELSKIPGGELAYINNLMEIEMLAHFVEKVILNETVAKKVFNTNPSAMLDLDTTMNKAMLESDSRIIKKASRLFVKYGKEALRYKNGSLMDAISRNIKQDTYVKIGDNVYKVDKSITGFYNANTKYNLEASMNETHYVRDNFGQQERQYSDFSKQELNSFFELFDPTRSDLDNNLDAIIKHLLKPYMRENDYTYKEIIGTKYAYVWALMNANPEIRSQIVAKVEERLAKIMSEKNHAKMGLEKTSKEGVYKINGSGKSSALNAGRIFWEIFALNYIIGDPRYVASVSLNPVRAYINEGKSFYVFNNGKGGYMVSKNFVEINENYRKKNLEYGYETAFEDSELASVFNNGEVKSSDMNLKDFIFANDKIKNIIATNSKLEQLYQSWGFTTEYKYNYDNQMMSEWSNSYQNYLAHQAELNGVELAYIGLSMKKLKPFVNGITQIEWQARQLDTILNTNPMLDDYHVGIRTLNDILAFNEIDFKDENNFVYPDFTLENARQVLKDGEVVVYSSKPIEQGTFVSPSKMQAQDYAGSGQVYSKTIPLEHVAWISGDEGQYTGDVSNADISNLKINEIVNMSLKSMKKLSPKSDIISESVIASESEALYFLDIWNKLDYKTRSNIKAFDITSEDYYASYIKNNYISEGSKYNANGLFYERKNNKREWYNSEKLLPVDRTIYMFGQEVELTKEMFSIVNPLTNEVNTPKNAYWDARSIINEMKEVHGIKLTQEQQQKIINLEQKDFNLLKGILERGENIPFGASHHMGTNLEMKSFYRLNPEIVMDFLNNGKFRIDYESNKNFLGYFGIDLKDARTDKVYRVNTFGLLNEAFFDGKTKDFDFSKNQEYFIHLNEVFHSPYHKNFMENPRGIYFDGENYHFHTFRGAIKDNVIIRSNVARLKDGSTVTIENIRMHGKLVSEADLNSQAKMVSERIKNIHRNFLTMRKINPNRQGVINKINTKQEMNHLNDFVKESYNNFDKKAYLESERNALFSISNIDFESISKKPNGKRIESLIKHLLKTHQDVISKSFNNTEIYNHTFNRTIQEVIRQLANNFGETGFKDKNEFINALENALSSSNAYVDEIFRDNKLDMENKLNPDGFQYYRNIHWGVRDLYKANTQAEINKVVSDRKMSPFFDLLEAGVSLDITDKQSMAEFLASIKQMKSATTMSQKNIMFLDSELKTFPTLYNVTQQNNIHIDNLLDLLGNTEAVVSKDKHGNNVIKGYKRQGGLVDVPMFDRFSGTRLDMYAFGNIFGNFMEESTGNVLTKRLQEAQIRQLEVTNSFYDHFEHDKFINKHSKEINALEKETSTLNNLVNKRGTPITMPNSQVLYLRNILFREIVRNRLIEQGHREGAMSNHFKDGGLIYIAGNSGHYMQNIDNRIEGKITNLIDLFNEVNKIVESHAFMPTYNERVLSFFDSMYDFENITNKDMFGLELTNDMHFINDLDDAQKQMLLLGLDVNEIKHLYVPLRLVGGNEQYGTGAFDIGRIIDLGINDGMIRGITESSKPPLIETINHIVPRHLRSVTNYYGLYRLVNDLNVLFKQSIELEDGSRMAFSEKVNSLSPYIIPYYEKLLKDMSGYGDYSDITGQETKKLIGTIRRNFFKASLGLNIKVIMTQFASLFTTSAMYGDFQGTKQSLMLGMWKNLFAKKNKAQYYIENSHLYKDRARNSSYEMREATSSKFAKGKFNQVTEMFMAGINATDAMINRALFVTLVEHGYSNEQAMAMTDEAILRYQSSPLPIGKNELLRTSNEYVKIFTRFLSEPMKVVSNIEESIRHLKAINEYAKNQQAINEHFDNKLQALETKFKEETELLKSLKEDLANEKDSKQKKKIKDEIRVLQRELYKTTRAVELERINNVQVKKQVQELIDSHAKVKKIFAKRISALVQSLTWQTLLGVLFTSIRKQNPKEEDEAVWAYLSKMFGAQFLSEAIGYIPFARDVYGTLVNKYDSNAIADFQALNGMLKAMNSLFVDITNGGDFNSGRHIRNISIYLGQTLGMPTRQIERLFTTPAGLLAPNLEYAYRDITGQKTASNKELEQAIARGDMKTVETIIDRKLNSKSIPLTNATRNEIINLAKDGANVNPSGIPNEFTIDGVEYENDKDKFAKTYEGATYVVEKIIKSSKYKKLDSKHKAKLIKAIFNYYYNLAKQEVSGVKIYSKERVYSLNQAYKYFSDRISYYANMQKKEEQENKKKKSQ